MKKCAPRLHIILLVVLCTCCAGYVDGVLQPPYFQRAALKAGLFIGIPICSFLLRGLGLGELKRLLVPKNKELRFALILGCGVYMLILSAYFLFTRFYDISELVRKLTSDAGVGAENFLAVSLYISLVNSLLEEFFFRGFAFLTLRKSSSGGFSCLFSAGMFALYHFGMMAAGNIWISILALIALFAAGCMFNWLDERNGHIINSWLVHMFANFAINTVGCLIFGIL